MSNDVTITIKDLEENGASGRHIRLFRKYCGESVTWEGGFTIEDQIAVQRGPLGTGGFYLWASFIKKLLPRYSPCLDELYLAGLDGPYMGWEKLYGEDFSGEDLVGANMSRSFLAGADLSGLNSSRQICTKLIYTGPI
jgi:hypothetical protein